MELALRVYTCTNITFIIKAFKVCMYMYIQKFMTFACAQIQINPFASGIKKVLLYPITGLFSVKIRIKFLAIKNFSVNDTMSGQPNKRLIH